MKLNSCEDCPLRREYEVRENIFYTCGLLNLTDAEKKMVISIPVNCMMTKALKNYQPFRQNRTESEEL